MVTEFKFPKLGEDIESGDVLNILVDVGDSVTHREFVRSVLLELRITGVAHNSKQP